MTAADVRRQLEAQVNPEKAAFFPRFFKAGPGQYAEGDTFLGVTVPRQRAIAKAAYKGLPLAEVLKLLQGGWHEERLTALLVLVLQFQKGDEAARQAVYKAYMSHLQWVNNWDLVDSSAPYIAGAWLLDKNRAVLYKLAKSPVLWERRVAMIATWWFIRNDDFADTLALAEKLLQDKQDLMHKAVGWMLREVGKRAPDLLIDFLEKHAALMPRTALRYAIEHFPADRRKYFMSLKVPPR
jgi:3-methyladenine DNA glycosylase AlkD